MTAYFACIKSEPISSVEVVDLFGLNPHSYQAAAFVVIKSKEENRPVVNLKVESEHSPTFIQVEVSGSVVLIGYGDRVILFDFLARITRFSIILEGYFSEFTLNRGNIYIATNANVICMNWLGEQKWVSPEVGIDGVCIHSVAEGKIQGSGEWDPPGGWEPFELDQRTGKQVSLDV